jgi:hypothetical protein
MGERSSSADGFVTIIGGNSLVMITPWTDVRVTKKL